MGLWLKCFIFFFGVFTLFAASQEEYLKRVSLNLILQDRKKALEVAEEAFYKFPKSKEVQSAYVRALAENERGKEALVVLKKIDPTYQDSNFLLEEIAWSILNEAKISSQPSLRYAALLGAYLTFDSRAIDFILTSLSDSNAVLRSIAVGFACDFSDFPLKKRVNQLLEEEKTWLVKLEIIKAIGEMKVKDRKDFLKEIIANDSYSYEEKKEAARSFVALYDSIDLEELKHLFKSDSASLRSFACDLASYFKVIEAKENILKLVDDIRGEVRVSALNAIAFFYREFISENELKKILRKVILDSDPYVSITACWLSFLADLDLAKEIIEKKLYSNYFENRALAAAALSKCSGKAVSIAKRALLESNDSYVKANLALGLIAQDEEIPLCLDILYNFIKNKDKRWMWVSKKNVPFEVLLPSTIRHIDQIPNYPEAIDQLVQLDILSILIVKGDVRSKEVLKDFLTNRRWGVTGIAAANLLKEGTEKDFSSLRALLKDENENVRVQAALVLAFYAKDETSLPILKEAYETADYYMKITIIEALGYIGNKTLVSFLVAAMEEPFQLLKTVAASSLIRSLNR